MKPGSAGEREEQRRKLDAAVYAEMRRRSRRGFLVAGVAAAGGYGFWRWIGRAAEIDGLSGPLRKVEEWNEAISRWVLGEGRLARTFPRSQAVADVRVNGDLGIDTGLKLDSWRLQVAGLKNAESFPQFVKDVNTWVYQSSNDAVDDAAGSTDDQQGSNSRDDAKGTDAKAPIQVESTTVAVDGSGTDTDQEPGLLLTMADLRSLPHVEIVTQLKCIEGWSEVVHWGGVRMADFIARYRPAEMSNGKPVRYVALETPDGGYYVGLHLASAMHPQTLLCYEMNGQPLTPEHGAPLRLVTPLKYGIKQLKQIGKIGFTAERPRDYWAEQGYDWYAGH